jgi:hypothetical protein
VGDEGVVDDDRAHAGTLVVAQSSSRHARTGLAGLGASVTLETSWATDHDRR